MGSLQASFLVLFLVLSSPWSVPVGAAAQVSGAGVVGADPVSDGAEGVVLQGAKQPEADEDGTEYFEDDGWLEEENYEEVQIADPFEPLNRIFFNFNDKLYFWLLKPLARTYSFVAPKPVRRCVGNFFYNLKTPIRFTNNLLQGKFVAGGTELTRFVVNTTVGVAGLWDPARNWFDMSASAEDFGQTLGRYGIGEGVYICWPVLGPSNIRDTLGTAGDYFLDPVSHLGFNDEGEEAFALWAEEKVNRTSLRLGDYEDFKNATFDPYRAMRDAYFHQRRAKIRDGE
ncbi:MAG: VacJ family lipoprotein [Desulfobulbaceae bacterium]|nr:VacJ family lipoprotein [Desulfobulbaceae bacterium]